MPRIDVGALLAGRAPRLARRIPRCVVDALRRYVREAEINRMLDAYGDLPPQQFIRACLRAWGVAYAAVGFERLDPAGRYLFVSNHPFGGMDGMMLADLLIERFGDARVVVNDLLMHLEPLRPLWLPVNKHGAQRTEYARRMDEAYCGDVPILTFPAGLCSRRVRGEVTDPEWKPGFLKKALAAQREIVPLFVEGRLSGGFYRLARLRELLGVKFNAEMVRLPAELFSQQGRRFRLVAGEPIRPADLQRFGSLHEQAAEVRRRTYSLRDAPAPRGDGG